MARDKKHDPNPNENATPVGKQATSADTISFADVEAAWLEWAASFQNVAEQDLELLRAAFEAGYEAGAASRSK